MPSRPRGEGVCPHALVASGTDAEMTPPLGAGFGRAPKETVLEGRYRGGGVGAEGPTPRRRDASEALLRTTLGRMPRAGGRPKN